MSSSSRRRNREDRQHCQARKSSGAGIEREPLIDIDTVGAYLVFEKMGAGAFGEVYKGMHMVSGDTVAIKRLKSSPGHANNAFVEADVLALAGTHHHCLSLHEVREAGNENFLITDYCVGGDLYDYCFPSELSKNEDSIWVLEEAEAIDLFAQLILALEHVHKCGYVHGDVKLENVFLHSPEHIVLGDFGMATAFEKGKRMKAKLATTHYCCPEAYLDIPGEGPESDVWAAGIFLFIMIHGRYPFFGDTKTEIMQSICTSEPKFDSDISAPVQRMLKRMLTKRPRHRITIAEIKKLRVMRKVIAAVQRDCDMAAEKGWMSNCTSRPATKLSRAVSGPTSKGDFSLLARNTRVLDASIIPPEANPFRIGKEEPVVPKKELLGPATRIGPKNPFLTALLEIQANFDDLAADAKTPPRRRGSRSASADDMPREQGKQEPVAFPSLTSALAKASKADHCSVNGESTAHAMGGNHQVTVT